VQSLAGLHIHEYLDSGLSWGSRIDPTNQHFFKSDKSQYRERAPDGSQFPIEIKGETAKENALPTIQEISNPRFA